MSRKAWMTWIALVAAVGCNSDGGTGNPDPDPTLAGEFSDPVGDNAAEPSSARDPDIIGVTVEIENGQMTVVGVFNPGSLDEFTVLQIGFDVDKDSTTGDTPTLYGGLGMEYFLHLGPNHAVAMYRFDAGTYTPVTTNATDPQGTDSMRVVLPMSLFGNDNGRLNFKAITAVALAAGGTTGILDWAPEFAALPVQVK